jgi:hypothetical protein
LNRPPQNPIEGTAAFESKPEWSASAKLDTHASKSGATKKPETYSTAVRPKIPTPTNANVDKSGAFRAPQQQSNSRPDFKIQQKQALVYRETDEMQWSSRVGAAGALQAAEAGGKEWAWQV